MEQQQLITKVHKLSSMLWPEGICLQMTLVGKHCALLVGHYCCWSTCDVSHTISSIMQTADFNLIYFGIREVGILIAKTWIMMFARMDNKKRLRP